MAHAFIQSFKDDATIPDPFLADVKGMKHNIIEDALACREELGFTKTNRGELLSYAAYARTFPTKFLALVDTYNTVHSGVLNFLVVATVLHRYGYKAMGVRLDSGDLADLSKKCRKQFIGTLFLLFLAYLTIETGEKLGIPYFSKFTIVASNDINEQKLLELNAAGHELDCYGIGTNLVTCEAQPALGAVFKLVEVHNFQIVWYSKISR